MTLRARLLLVLVGLVAAGLVITDVVTYTQLRSYLLARIEPELEAAAYPVARELADANGLPLDESAGRVPSGGTLPASSFPPTGFPRYPGRAEHTGGFGVAPADTIGELVGPGGKVHGKPLLAFYGSGKAVPPNLPMPLPTASSGGSVMFSASSGGRSPVDYEVLARPLHYDGLTEIVAIPLTDVTQTLGRLLLVELLVSGAVLLGLGGLAWWIVRRGLKPLDHMAVTAGAIAGGQLGLRVTPAEPRTEVGRLGMALNAMLGEIEDAFAARAASEGRLRRFLADASHELRTPLTSIRGYAELFEMGARDRPADLETAMRHIREEAQRMNVLVDDLLLLARLDQERPLALRPTDLVQLAAKSIAAWRGAAPDHPIELDAPASAVVPCDADRIRQVLDNLVGNAIRHSPLGAPVGVVVRALDGWVDVEVSDRGPGVPESEAARIFEPFYRADFARTRATGGAGLGLAIVAAIARAHGGAVGVRRNGAGGASFWFRLPRTPAALGSDPAATSADLNGGPQSNSTGESKPAHSPI